MGFDVKTRVSKLKSSAKARGLNINLDVNKYQVLIDNGCHFCGDNLNSQNGYCLDRIFPDKGYNLENVVACCKICNRAKSDMDYYDFIDWVNKANTFMQKQISHFKEMEANGITQEIYIEIEKAYYEELNKDKEKNRIKFINKGV